MLFPGAPIPFLNVILKFVQFKMAAIFLHTEIDPNESKKACYWRHSGTQNCGVLVRGYDNSLDAVRISGDEMLILGGSGTCRKLTNRRRPPWDIAFHTRECYCGILVPGVHWTGNIHGGTGCITGRFAIDVLYSSAGGLRSGPTRNALGPYLAGSTP